MRPRQIRQVIAVSIRVRINIVATGLIFPFVYPAKWRSIRKQSSERDEFARDHRRLVRQRRGPPRTERAGTIACEDSERRGAGVHSQAAEQKYLARLDVDQHAVTFTSDASSQFDLPAEAHFRGVH